MLRHVSLFCIENYYFLVYILITFNPMARIVATLLHIQTEHYKHFLLCMKCNRCVLISLASFTFSCENIVSNDFRLSPISMSIVLILIAILHEIK